MKRIVASLMVFIFIVGMLLLPALHRLHCDCDSSAHHAADCPICQLAHAPLDEAVTQVFVISAPSAYVVRLDSPLAVFVAAPACDSTQARAPPVFA